MQKPEGLPVRIRSLKDELSRLIKAIEGRSIRFNGQDQLLLAESHALESEAARLTKAIEGCTVPNTAPAQPQKQIAVPSPSVTPFPQVRAVLPPDSPIRTMTAEDKIALFMSFFKGREDVFARRWENKAGDKSGYQPVCANLWVEGTCPKKAKVKISCPDCPARKFRALTVDDISAHLTGGDAKAKDVIGLYAIRADNTCFFLCADFDDKNCEHGYQNDVRAYVSVCKDWGIHSLVERSRSGNGAHVWIFFAEAVPAGKARRLGDAILTESMNRDAQMSFKSYDRFFPNQDFLPAGGFGNLVALPLQGRARRKGNSVFVDTDFQAYPDPWLVLKNTVKVTAAELDTLLAEHSDYRKPFGILTETAGEDQAWKMPDPEPDFIGSLPDKITITRDNVLLVPRAHLPAAAVNRLKRIAAFKNPEFFKKLRMNLSTYGLPRVLSYADVMPEYVALPRGCEDAVTEFFKDGGVEVQFSDRTNRGQPIDVSFKGELRPEQQEAVRHMTAHVNGVLFANTAFGKTVTAIGMIAALKTSTLILVNSVALLEQWQASLERFLEIRTRPQVIPGARRKKSADSPIGTLHSSKNRLHGIIDIALLQSCENDGEPKPFLKEYGMVIIDECHHVAAPKFNHALREINASRVYGLTATPLRQDGHQPIIFMQCGPVRFKSKEAAAADPASEVIRLLIPRFTAYREISDDKLTYLQIIQRLSADQARNRLIVKDVAQCLQEGRTPLVISHLTDHVELLATLLRPLCRNVILLTGARSASERKEETARLMAIPDTEHLVIVATDKYIGEGFDYPRLDTLMLTLPIFWKGSVIQYVGRLHRAYKGKTETRTYDYIDVRIPMCDSMYKKRLRGYRIAGYQLGDQNLCRPGTADIKNSLFSAENWREQFINDLAAARHSVLAVTYRIDLKDSDPLLQELMKAQARGVAVRISYMEGNSAEGSLKALGLDVRKSPGRVQCAVIDKEVCWYGDINFLGNSAADVSAMRLKDPEIAGELIDSLVPRKTEDKPV
jgi:superfamily II DNA or RNA helicase